MDEFLSELIDIQADELREKFPEIPEELVQDLAKYVVNIATEALIRGVRALAEVLEKEQENAID